MKSGFLLSAVRATLTIILCGVSILSIPVLRSPIYTKLVHDWDPPGPSSAEKFSSKEPILIGLGGLRNQTNQTNRTSRMKKSRTFPTTRVVVYRIIGNNVPFIHGLQQNIRNTRYIVENEESHPEVQKRFIVNRILNRTIEQHLIWILSRRFPKEDIIRIPFEPSAVTQLLRANLTGRPPCRGSTVSSSRASELWRKFTRSGSGLDSDTLAALPNQTTLPSILTGVHEIQLNQYISNQNSARNRAIVDSIAMGYRCWFPFDGNVFIPPESMKQLVSSCDGKSARTIFVPMQRMVRDVHGGLANESHLPLQAVESSDDSTEEPQLGFQSPCKLRYSEDPCYNYGSNNKIELIRRATRNCPLQCTVLNETVWRLPSFISSVLERAVVVRGHHLRAYLRIMGMQNLLAEALAMASELLESTRSIVS